MNYVRSIDSFEYLAPKSLNEALQILQREKDNIKILNGGTDLVLQMKQGLVQPRILMDVKNIPELQKLDWEENKGLCIGAAVPISRILEYNSLPDAYDILMQSFSLIGSVQIKNRGTIGGNICNAAPSADSATPLICLGAEAVLLSANQSRTVLLQDLFTGSGQTVIKDDELLIEIIIPTPPPDSTGCYLRHTAREEMDIAVVGVASLIKLKNDRQIEYARVALGAVGPTPLRAFETEEYLTEKQVTNDVFEKAAEIAASEARPISDMRGSAEYRRELVRVLTRRTLIKASNQPVGPKNI